MQRAIKSKVIEVYTDGSARGNPGPAGWGVVILHKGRQIELGGRRTSATNNQMELTAAIRALEFLKEKKVLGQIEIHSDSKYVITGINEWIHNWVKNGWRTANKKPVLNKELWQELHELNQSLEPAWHYVTGHSGHEHNDRADEIATSYADNEPIV